MKPKYRKYWCFNLPGTTKYQTFEIYCNTFKTRDALINGVGAEPSLNYKSPPENLECRPERFGYIPTESPTF